MYSFKIKEVNNEAIKVHPSEPIVFIFRFEGGGSEECSLLAEALSVALQVC